MIKVIQIECVSDGDAFGSSVVVLEVVVVKFAGFLGNRSDHVEMSVGCENALEDGVFVKHLGK